MSVATAFPGDQVTVRLMQAPRSIKKPLHLYMVSTQFASDVHLSSDLRLYAVGVLRAKKDRSLTFTVPSFSSGTYVLAYCRCNPAAALAVNVLRGPALRVQTPPEGASCAVTRPNGTAPEGVSPSPSFYGNGTLWVQLPSDGVLQSQDPDGKLFDKMLWLGVAGTDTRLHVSYRRLNVAAPALAAVTLYGSYGGYSPSWASRMYFDRGCWQVRGKVGVSMLEFVVRVVGP